MYREIQEDRRQFLTTVQKEPGNTVLYVFAEVELVAVKDGFWAETRPAPNLLAANCSLSLHQGSPPKDPQLLPTKIRSLICRRSNLKAQDLCQRRDPSGCSPFCPLNNLAEELWEQPVPEHVGPEALVCGPKGPRIRVTPKGAPPDETITPMDM